MTGSGRPTAEGALPWVDGGDDPALESLDSARTKLVALCLARERSATLAELQSLLGEPRCALLRILGVLADRGLVERVEGTYHFLGSDDDVGGGDDAVSGDAGRDGAGTTAEPGSPTPAGGER